MSSKRRGNSNALRVVPSPQESAPSQSPPKYRALTGVIYGAPSGEHKRVDVGAVIEELTYEQVEHLLALGAIEEVQ